MTLINFLPTTTDLRQMVSELHNTERLAIFFLIAQSTTAHNLKKFPQINEFIPLVGYFPFPMGCLNGPDWPILGAMPGGPKSMAAEWSWHL
jgi:hypothetical protein